MPAILNFELSVWPLQCPPDGRACKHPSLVDFRVLCPNLASPLIDGHCRERLIVGVYTDHHHEVLLHRLLVAGV